MTKRRTRRPVPMDWIVNQAAAWNVAATTAGGGGTTQIELIGSNPASESSDPISITRFTMLAIRGHLLIEPPDTAGTYVLNFGIYKTKISTATGPAFLDASEATDAPNDDWLWFQHLLITVDGKVAANPNIPSSIEVNVRSKRLIKGGDQVYLVMTNQGTDTVTWTPYLRTLVRGVA